MTNQIVDKKTVSVAIPGDRGPAGEIIEVTAETLPTGAEATVTLGGTPDQRTMHLGLPRGGKGDPGDGSVDSVNGDFGPDIVLDAEAVGAIGSINGITGPHVSLSFGDISNQAFLLVDDFGAKGDGVTDDTLAIQRALDEAAVRGSGSVFFGAKKYVITDFLVVGSGTRITAYGAHIINMGGKGLIRSFRPTDNAPGYSGAHSILIEGGIWDQNCFNGVDGAGKGITTSFNFVHGKNITVQNLTLRDVSGGHAVEFNAVDGGRVIDCVFEGYHDNTDDASRGYVEAVQLDCALNIVMEPKDLTPAINIDVIRCVARPSERCGQWPRLVASHTGVTEPTIYRGVRVIDCSAKGLLDGGIHGYGWESVVIRGNIFEEVEGRAINLVVPLKDAWGYSLLVQNIIVDGNIITDCGEGIRVVGEDTARTRQVTVTNNQVRGVTKKHGIEIVDAASPLIMGNQVRDVSNGSGIFAQAVAASIKKNTIYNTSTNNIVVNGRAWNVISDNYCELTQSNYGIFVGPNGAGDPATQCVISDNIVIRAAVAGIRLSTAATDCTVKNNRVIKGTGSTQNGILNVAGATGCVIVGNDFSRNGWTAAQAINVSTSSPVLSMSGGKTSPGDNLV